MSGGFQAVGRIRVEKRGVRPFPWVALLTKRTQGAYVLGWFATWRGAYDEAHRLAKFRALNARRTTDA